MLYTETLQKRVCKYSMQLNKLRINTFLVKNKTYKDIKSFIEERKNHRTNKDHVTSIGYSFSCHIFILKNSFVGPK